MVSLIHLDYCLLNTCERESDIYENESEKTFGSKCEMSIEKRNPSQLLNIFCGVHKYFERRVKFEEAESAQGSWTRPLPICTELRKSE